MRKVTGGRENFEQFRRVVSYMELLPILRLEKTGRGHPVEELEEWVEESSDIQHSDRFVMQPQLLPGEDFKEFVHGSDAARQDEEGVGQIHHATLPLVHGLDTNQLGNSVMCQFPADEVLGDHSDDLTSRRKTGIGEGSHQTDVTAAVNQSKASRGQLCAEGASRVGVSLWLPGAGAAEYADMIHFRL